MKALEEKTGKKVESEDSELARIGVSLPSNLLNKFEKIIRGRGYSSRSEGIRDAIRAYIIEHEWMERESGEKIGVIAYTYDHSQRELRRKLEETENDFKDIIETSSRALVDDKTDFATVTVKGDAKQIKELAERIMSQRGVKYLKLTITRI